MVDPSRPLGGIAGRAGFRPRPSASGVATVCARNRGQDEPVTDNPMTAEELETLRAELEQLEGPARAEMAEQIKTARGWGDLKENAEYHAAKEAQAHLETKILKLRERVLTATVVETASGDVVDYGSTVEVEDEQTGARHSYTLVSSRDAAP